MTRVIRKMHARHFAGERCVSAEIFSIEVEHIAQFWIDPRVFWTALSPADLVV
jgi:hypothetical protein